MRGTSPGDNPGDGQTGELVCKLMIDGADESTGISISLVGAVAVINATAVLPLPSCAKSLPCGNGSISKRFNELLMHDREHYEGQRWKLRYCIISRRNARNNAMYHGCIFVYFF